ncbi:hypothetical protein Dimus_032569 [Dionaea muscipula]
MDHTFHPMVRFIDLDALFCSYPVGDLRSLRDRRALGKNGNKDLPCCRGDIGSNLMSYGILVCVDKFGETKIGKHLSYGILATGEAKSIPRLTTYVDLVRLGRDPRTSEYKILTISIHNNMTSIGWHIWDQTSIKAEVCSLGSSSSWRVLDVSNFFDGFERIDDTYPYYHQHSLHGSIVGLEDA